MKEFFHKLYILFFRKRVIKLNIKAFAVALSNSLIVRGIDKETAVSNVLRIMRSLSEEDHREIERYKDASDFSTLSDTLAQFIDEEKRLAEAIEEEQRNPTLDIDGDISAKTRFATHSEGLDVSHVPNARTIAVPVVKGGDAPVQSSFSDTITVSAPSAHTASREIHPQRTRVDMPAVPSAPPIPDKDKGAARHYTEYTQVKLTGRGKKFFVGGIVLTFPLILAAFIAFYGIFALCVASVAALIVATFVILAGLVILGSLACLIGIIYGITQMFGSVGIGLYEIGVGVIASGVTMVISVLVYHTGTKVLPYLMRQLVAFFRQMMDKFPLFVDRVKEECNRL